jgi:hypothetical protein
VTGEVTWVDHFTPQTKKVGMQWKHLTFLTVKKFKVCRSAGKVMASVFWDADGVIHVEGAKQSMQKPTVTCCNDCEGILTQNNLDICHTA